jgi:hypothetical protein
MNYHALLLFTLVASPLAARGQLEWIPNETPQAVFAGKERQLKLTIRNPADKPVELQIRMRLLQLSSGSAMPVEDARSWKTLKLLPGQTVLEHAVMDFPAVKARTLFEIRWADAKDRSLGQTAVEVYPDDLLKQLATLTEQKPVGLIDPDSQVKPLLKRAEIGFEDLEPGTAIEKFDGSLIVVFTRSPKKPQTPHLSERIIARVKEGIAVVWIEWEFTPCRTLQPLAYSLRAGRGTMFFAQASTVADLANSPQSQLNLIHFAEIALIPGTLQLPETP